MRSNALQALADDIAADRRVTAEEALKLRQDVFPDGVVTRDEAEVLMDLEAKVANSDPAWADAFVEAVTDHVLNYGKYPGHIDEPMVAWLKARFGDDGARETEVEVVLKLLERCESAPDSLHAYARDRVSVLLKGAPYSAADVERVRRCLYAGDSFVSEDEARWLFALDAESDGRANAPSWGDLFVKAVMNHLMGRHATALLEAEGMKARQDWLRDTSINPWKRLSHMFDGGLNGYVTRARELGELDQLETYYEAVNANADEDAQLTLTERAWAVGMTQEDGKLTTNEKVLLAELEKVQNAGA